MRCRLAFDKVGQPLRRTADVHRLLATPRAQGRCGVAFIVPESASRLHLDVMVFLLPSSPRPPYTTYEFAVEVPTGKSLCAVPLTPCPHYPVFTAHLSLRIVATPIQGRLVVVARRGRDPKARTILFDTPWIWPTVRPSCLNGVDNNLDLGAAATCLATKGYRFVGRYLGGPCYPGVVLSTVEAVQLSQAGLAIVSLYSGANVVRAFRCGVQSSEAGSRDGLNAVNQAVKLRQPPHSAIFLDLQGNQISPPADWLNYIKGWVQAVQQNQYQPGIYSSPSQLLTIEAEPWAGSSLLYWVAKEYADTEVIPPPCPTVVLPFAAIWQYALSVTVCGSPGADIDSAVSTDFMWSLT
ncbi:MAG: DUF1906 domain-containing protein [Firmicutes bacterium]|nr:DUF1906 domain-containing protein [Bacillota bacterium]